MMKYLFSLYLLIYLFNPNFIKTMNISKSHSINLEFISEDSQKQEKKNLIIGAFSNYSWDKIKTFFKSYQNVGFKNCDCVMFVSNLKKKTIDEIKSRGVIVYPIPEKYKDELIINVRWKIYEDYLNKNQDKYKLVFTADIRDVFYQRDLFQFYDSTKPFLGIAIEDGTLTGKHSRDWLIEAYGEELYKTIMNERIFCVGTVWGTTDKFTEFAKTMWNRISALPSKIWGVEQAVGNFMIYHDKMFNDCLIMSNNTDGYIMTIGITKPKNIILNLDIEIMNRKGEIAAVVHQYDRHDILTKLVEDKYNPENKLYKLINIIIIIIIVIVLDIIVVIIVIYIWKRKINTKSSKIDDFKIEMVKIPKKEVYLDDEEITSEAKLINQ